MQDLTALPLDILYFVLGRSKSQFHEGENLSMRYDRRVDEESSPQKEVQGTGKDRCFSFSLVVDRRQYNVQRIL